MAELDRALDDDIVDIHVFAQVAAWRNMSFVICQPTRITFIICGGIARARNFNRSRCELSLKNASGTFEQHTAILLFG